jgi:hypothetical protein
MTDKQWSDCKKFLTQSIVDAIKEFASNLEHDITVGGITDGPLGANEDGCPCFTPLLRSSIVAYELFTPLLLTTVSYPCCIQMLHTLVAYKCFIPMFLTLVAYPLWGGWWVGWVLVRRTTSRRLSSGS